MPCRSLRSLVALLLGAPTLIAAAEPAAQRPNVLFIAVDDMRDWVGYLGRNPQTITPNLDKLAARGVYFTRSYCAAPVCNPSRAALMSGLRPATSGVYDNGNDWRTVMPEELMLTTQFRKAGYDVRGSGKIYHEAYKRTSEWDAYQTNSGADPKPNGDTGVGGIAFAPLDCKDEDLREWKITDYAIDQLQKKHDKPFFLACGLHKPHMPWNVPRKYYEMHPLDQIQLPPYLETDLADIPPAGIKMAHPETDHAKILASGRWKEAIQSYLAAISYSDAMIGRLMDAFDKSEHRDNTIVVFWSDHGWHLGEKHHWRKFALWEESTRSPMIWVVPGLTKPNVACDRPVDFMSIYPTLTDLCGIPTPKHVEGKSLRTLLGDPKATWDQPALTTYRFKNHAVRTEEWRYIRYANGDEELYNEAKDPNEWTNLATLPEYAAKKAELAKLFPTHDQADIGGNQGTPAAKKAARQKKAAP
ncbi:Arylsulfatase A [Singulisphaera sp. GP187]|uniref:sulfatase n=1 Tax=Singulisphaera sp. GP187 TaxID=1882752 RepID=UPI0009259AD6|nr:sulfatase [Singulisphaera sp. GP187]SIO61804.1 Arylsulfatase A [Singulisphaera sp. GP187]